MLLKQFGQQQQQDEAAASSSTSVKAQGDLAQHRRKKVRRNKIELTEDPYLPSAAAKQEPEAESDEEVINTEFLQEQLKKADILERRKKLMAEIDPSGKDPTERLDEFAKKIKEDASERQLT